MGKAFVLDDPDYSLRRGASAEQRLTEAIRRHYRHFGAAPSYRELEGVTGIRRNDISRHLRQLEGKGVLKLQPGVARGIHLFDRGAMLSDIELELAAAARGASIVWPKDPVSGLAIAYKLPVGTDCGLPLDDLLAQVNAAAEGLKHGGTAEIEAGTHYAGEDQVPPPPRHRRSGQARRRP